jgi:hypothetical protein
MKRYEDTKNKIFKIEDGLIEVQNKTSNIKAYQIDFSKYSYSSSSVHKLIEYGYLPSTNLLLPNFNESALSSLSFICVGAYLTTIYEKLGEDILVKFLFDTSDTSYNLYLIIH